MPNGDGIYTITVYRSPRAFECSCISAVFHINVYESGAYMSYGHQGFTINQVSISASRDGYNNLLIDLVTKFPFEAGSDDEECSE